MSPLYAQNTPLYSETAKMKTCALRIASGFSLSCTFLFPFFIFYHNLSSLPLMVWVYCCFEDLEEKNQ